jgi:hypothetical protein
MKVKQIVINSILLAISLFGIIFSIIGLSIASMDMGTLLVYSPIIAVSIIALIFIVLDFILYKYNLMWLSIAKFIPLLVIYFILSAILFVYHLFAFYIVISPFLLIAAITTMIITFKNPKTQTLKRKKKWKN